MLADASLIEPNATAELACCIPLYLASPQEIMRRRLVQQGRREGVVGIECVDSLAACAQLDGLVFVFKLGLPFFLGDCLDSVRRRLPRKFM